MYSIQEVSNLTGISTGNLRYYEKEKLLTDIKRTPGGIRQYSDKDLERLHMICCLKNTGMSIRKIAQFVQLDGEGDQTLAERVKILNEHREHVIAQLEKLKKHLEKISEKVECVEKQLDKHNSNYW